METSVNSWQNIGIMYIYALKHIPHKYRDTYMMLVRNSFGYSKSQTIYATLGFWAEKSGASISAIKRHIHYLVKNEHVQVIKKHEFIEGGGKNPYAYRVSYPDVGNIHIDKTMEPKEKYDPNKAGWNFKKYKGAK